MPFCKTCKKHVNKYTYNARCLLCILKKDIFVLILAESPNSKIYEGEYLHKPTGLLVKAKHHNKEALKAELLILLVTKLRHINMN